LRVGRKPDRYAFRLAEGLLVPDTGWLWAVFTLIAASAQTVRNATQRGLTAQLGTEGVVVGGAVRSAERISVGTREQLSTLYRLSMAEYLCTAVVLDDQLVQSDGTRMDWFRALLAEKARSFQIVVFTCRPDDYVGAGALVPKGKTVHRDTDSGFVRAIDLGRADIIDRLRRGEITAQQALSELEGRT